MPGTPQPKLEGPCVASLQLGVSFPIVLEANHVVNMATQVWAGAITAGCDGVTLTVNPGCHAHKLQGV